MNGIQALRRLQNTPETRDIPVIAVTSNSMPQDIEAGLKAGFTAYLTKPIRVSEVMQTIDRTLEAAAGPGQTAVNPEAESGRRFRGR
jgi:CheY-like chemotaxis protein